ncbi:MAG: ATP-binding protein [Saprospiraceae bacterium]
MKENAQESHALLVSIIKNAPYGVIAVDKNGSIMMCNKLALNQLRISRKAKEIIGSTLTNNTNRIPKLHKRLNQYFNKMRKAFNLNNVLIGERNFNIKGRSISTGMIITISDITETKVMERKVLNAILEGQEGERSRLAKEIHDGIGPLLSTIKLNLDTIKSEIDIVSEKTRRNIYNIEELVTTVASDIRSISHSLMPAALKDFGLIPTLENLVLKINNSEKVDVKLFHSNMEERLEEQVELGLYRMIQELLNNILKYAIAKNITIQIVKHPSDLTLTIEDDGLGFDKEKIEELMSSGIGLRNVKARTEALLGNLIIDTSPGNGVMTTIEIPL